MDCYECFLYDISVKIIQLFIYQFKKVSQMISQMEIVQIIKQRIRRGFTIWIPLVMRTRVLWPNIFMAKFLILLVASADSLTRNGKH